MTQRPDPSLDILLLFSILTVVLILLYGADNGKTTKTKTQDRYPYPAELLRPSDPELFGDGEGSVRRGSRCQVTLSPWQEILLQEGGQSDGTSGAALGGTASDGRRLLTDGGKP